MSASVVYGNTYQRIPDSSAKMNRSKEHKKVHDWMIYVDVIDGNPDVIDHVEFHMGTSFRPSSFCHRIPIRIQTDDGAQRWRFSSRQQTYGMIICAIIVHGRGGSILPLVHQIQTRPCESSEAHHFVETRPYKEMGPEQIPDVKFGIELELSSANTETPHRVAQELELHSKKQIVVMTHDRDDARRAYAEWKIVRDASIVCHRDRPDCNAFELVSPVLCGVAGLKECDAVVASLAHVGSMKVNKSMGFHVHVNVQNIRLKNLAKIYASTL